jgi:hypothetical protein
VAFSAVILPLMSQGELDLPLPERFTFAVAISNAGDCARVPEVHITAITRTDPAIRIAIPPPLLMTPIGEIVHGKISDLTR